MVFFVMECKTPIVHLAGLILFGEAHLRHLIREYVAHYNAERYHQSIGGKLFAGEAAAANDNSTSGVDKSRSRLDGTLNFYHRDPA